MKRDAGEWLKLACSILLVMNLISSTLAIGVTMSGLMSTSLWERMIVYDMAFVSFLAGTVSCLIGICIADIHGYFWRVETAGTQKPKMPTGPRKAPARPEDDLPSDWLKS